MFLGSNFVVFSNVLFTKDASPHILVINAGEIGIQVFIATDIGDGSNCGKTVKAAASRRKSDQDRVSAPEDDVEQPGKRSKRSGNGYYQRNRCGTVGFAWQSCKSAGLQIVGIGD